MNQKVDPELRPMCSQWTISFIGPEKKTAFNHVIHNITAERTTRWLIRAIKKAGGNVLSVTEHKTAKADMDVTLQLKARKPVWRKP